jgi:predicted nucleic acid-binding protein
MLLVDTNVLVDVLQNDTPWADWSTVQMRAQARLHALVINPVFHAEMALASTAIDWKADSVKGRQRSPAPPPP